MVSVKRIPEKRLSPKRISATIAYMLAHPDTLYILPQEMAPYRAIEALTSRSTPQEKERLTRIHIARDVIFSSKVVLHNNSRTLRIRRGKNGLSRALAKAAAWGNMKDVWFEVLADASAMQTATELRQQIANLRCNIRVVRTGEPTVRTLLIAGAKNAGKSFFVNCLLGKDAASTDRHAKKASFVRYESDTFSIIDTAGVNVAQASENPVWGWEHVQDIGTDTLGVFVVNYSSHRTTDEENCLRAFVRFLAEHGLEPPLILVNRMDELYSSEEASKSFIRFATYLRSKFAEAGFGPLLVLPISAMTYRYAVSIEQELAAVGIDDRTLTGVQELNTKVRDHTRTAFLKQGLRHMEEFHGIQNPTIEDVKRASGIPLALAYIQGRQKG